MRAALTLALLLPALAHGAVVGGGITQQSDPTSSFIRLDLDETGPFAIGDDTVERPHLYAFDEDQNIVLDRALQVDVGQDVPAGQVVASHYVFFDPLWGTIVSGWVDFDAPIIGIATSRGTLIASDDLQNNAVTYLSPGLRGLEWQDRVRIDPDDPNRLRVAFQASSPGDYIRVFTMFSPAVQAPGENAAPGSVVRVRIVAEDAADIGDSGI